MTDITTGLRFLLTAVYAKYDMYKKLVLWDDLLIVANANSKPLVIGGDFNVVLNSVEKIGGNLVIFVDVEDFHHCKEVCGIVQVIYKGNPFT